MRDDPRAPRENISAFRLPPSSLLLGRALYGGDDAAVRAAATDVGLHVLDDLLAGRIAVLLEQPRGAHDLPGLAVAALRHLFLDPRLLQRVLRFQGQAFDGGNGL